MARSMPSHCLLIIYLLLYSAAEILSLAENLTAIATSTEKVTASSESPAISLSTMLPDQQNEIMNATLNEIQKVIDDSGRIAGIIIGVLSGMAVILALVGFFLYKQYLRRNVTSMNFDNPVYRKTTEDQFSLEKNQYQPAMSYPSSLEPLTSPGTNEFV